MAANAPVDLSPGAVIGGGRYTIDAPISTGAAGEVYSAHDVGGIHVAIKRLISPTFEARFEIEARLLARLEHPRVVPVVDYFQDDTGKYLVMKLVRGMDLADFLKDQGDPGLPVEEAIECVRQACEALQYVHEQQIVHRDVKPQNMILSERGVVLVDFGVAREIGEVEQGTQGIGTPRFMAPEVLVGEAVSPRSDVYGLAATLWMLLSGKAPVYDDRTPLSEEVPGVTAELEETLRGGLELHPERRIASATAFARAIGSPLRTTSGASLAISVPAPQAQRSLLEAIVRCAAGIFEAAAASIAISDETTDELVYRAAWGAGADEMVGVRLPAGTGIAGSAVSTGEGVAVPECHSDARFAAQIAKGTGYVPNTMLAVPLMRDGSAIGALSVLDRRDGGRYSPADLERARLFADLAVAALPAERV